MKIPSSLEQGQGLEISLIQCWHLLCCKSEERKLMIKNFIFSKIVFRRIKKSGGTKERMYIVRSDCDLGRMLKVSEVQWHKHLFENCLRISLWPDVRKSWGCSISFWEIKILPPSTKYFTNFFIQQYCKLCHAQLICMKISDLFACCIQSFEASPVSPHPTLMTFSEKKNRDEGKVIEAGYPRSKKR